jgi:hypothetical protein
MRAGESALHPKNDNTTNAVGGTLTPAAFACPDQKSDL